MAGEILIVRDAAPDSAAYDTAVSRALLRRVSEGHLPETFRLNLTGRVVAFGKRDTLEPGYHDAAVAARHDGFEPVERLVGGRAAVFHEGTLAFSWSIPDTDPAPGIHARFRRLTALLVRGFARLGIEAAAGELPGEYCPGEYSIHAGGRKVVGVGQRLARHAAHVGGVIVVADARLVNRALVPVYRRLGLAFDPAVTGSLQDVAPGVTMQATADAVLAELAREATLVPWSLDAGTVSLARRLAPDHRAPV